MPTQIIDLLDEYADGNSSPQKAVEGNLPRHSYLETKDTSQRNSYLADDGLEKQPLPLNYIVMLENTFSDPESVNFIFEFLPGQDLYWII